MLPKRVFIRASAHLARVRACGCCVPGCWREPVQAHHDRRDGRGGTGIKPSDIFCVPLCNLHHSQVHHKGVIWVEREYGLDLRAIATWQAYLSKQLGLIK